jgi:hypothetical protein
VCSLCYVLGAPISTPARLGLNPIGYWIHKELIQRIEYFVQPYYRYRSILLLGAIMQGAKNLQSLDRQLGVVDRPSVDVNAPGFFGFPAVLASIVVDVVKVQHVKIVDKAVRDGAFDPPPAHDLESPELECFVRSHATRSFVASIRSLCKAINGCMPEATSRFA